MPDGGETKALGTASRRRRRLPGDALIELEVGLGLTEEVPVRRLLRSNVPGGTSAGRGDRWLLGGRADMGKNSVLGSSLAMSKKESLRLLSDALRSPQAGGLAAAPGRNRSRTRIRDLRRRESWKIF
jgi:hypothetical protein